jgi:hypothetical protein
MESPVVPALLLLRLANRPLPKNPNLLGRPNQPCEHPAACSATAAAAAPAVAAPAPLLGLPPAAVWRAVGGGAHPYGCTSSSLSTTVICIMHQRMT